MADAQAPKERKPGLICVVILGFVLGILALVFIPIAGIIGYFVFAVPSPEEPDPACFARPVIDVRVGETVFTIPRAYKPHVSGDYIPRSGARICQRLGDPSIAAYSFSVSTSWLKNLSPELDPGFTAQVFVSGISRPLGYRSEMFSIAQRTLREKEIPVEGVEERHGFLAPEPVGKGTRYFIAAPGTVETPRGLPLTFDCDPTPSSTFRGTYLGHQCRTYYQLSENIRVRYIFFDAWHPMERWGELDASIREFIHGLER